MSIIYLDCGMGAAGDMITASLLELLPDQDAFVEKLNHIGIKDVVYQKETVSKCGISATKINVLVRGIEEDENMHDHSGHHHSHEHSESHHDMHSGDDHHHHHHHHASLKEIEEQIDAFAVPDEIKKDIKAVYKMIGEAESHVHGVPVTDIHFHEVGTADALADISAACMLIHELKPDRILCSPIQVGSGTVKCAHGILPVPAPATAYLLQGVPIYSTDIKGELCTPTGAALLKYFVDQFTDMPPIRMKAIGYGMGKKDFTRLNCVRSVLGEEDGLRDSILELSCNIDDMTGEDLGFAMQKILDAGAKDVWTVPITMKKSRPAVMLCSICKPEDKESVIRSIFSNTTTIGIRESRMDRYILNREIVPVETKYGTIRKKTCSGYGVVKEKPEYDDLAKAADANGISLEEARKAFRTENE